MKVLFHLLQKERKNQVQSYLLTPPSPDNLASKHSLLMKLGGIFRRKRKIELITFRDGYGGT